VAGRGVAGDEVTPLPEAAINLVEISANYEVAIPRSICERLGLKPGQTMQVIAIGDRVELIPVRSTRSVRGFVRGIDSHIERGTDRE
jgi:AbrB family looped-hinge helix DNA binding protein